MTRIIISIIIIMIYTYKYCKWKKNLIKQK